MLTLANPVPNREHLPPVLGAALAGLAMVAGLFAMPVDLGPTELTTMVRLGFVTLTMGCAFLLNNGAVALTTVVAVGRGRQTCARMMQGTTVVLAWWSVTVALVYWRSRDQGWSGAWTAGLLVEGAATFAVAAATAAVLAPVTGGRPGVAASLVVLGAIGVVWVLPWPIGIVLPPGDPHWVAAHLVWAGVLGCALVVLVAAARERR